MNTLNCLTRIVAAAGSLAVTAMLVATVVSFAEPQRSGLMAKTAAAQKLAEAPQQLKVAGAR
jgi:hypothetical protein